MNLLLLSWKNLTYKPLNLLMSLVLFGLGVGLITFLILVDRQLEEKKDNNLAGIDLVIGAKGSPLQLILCAMYHVDNPTGNIRIGDAKAFMRPEHPLIATAVPVSVGDNYQNYRIVGTTPAYLDLYEATIAQGRIWEALYEVVIGASVANDLGLKLGDEFQSSHGLVTGFDTHEGAFKVVGILASTNSVIDQLILCNTPSIWAAHDDHGGPEIDSVAGGHEAHSYDLTKPLYEFEDQEITALLVRYKMRNFQTISLPRNINENTPFMAAPPPILINSFYDQLGVGIEAIQYLAYAIAVVSGLSLFIFLYSSLKERKYELALMRVMGGSSAQLFFLVLLEALIIAIWGYLIGLLLSHGGMELLGGFLKENFRYEFSGWKFYPLEWIVFGVAVLVAFLVAVGPAIQASRTDISETLSA